MAGLTIPDSLMQGEVEPGFEAVEAEFRRNFSLRGEVGAACAIYHQGRKVVDLWGGYRDARTRAPWKRDTIVLVFSTTQGMAATVMAVARSRGLIDYDEKVSTYWPEFAQQGKEDVTIRQLLSHQAGLPVIDEPLGARKLANLDALADILARQKPAWKPGTRHGYHALSLGWYEGELIRRVDPKHRTLGTFFEEEIAEPLNLEFFIGLPEGIPTSRIAAVKDFSTLDLLFNMNSLPKGFATAMLQKGSLTQRAIRNPKVDNPSDYNRIEYLVVESPAGGGIGEARSVAKVYSLLATRSEELGVSRETLDALEEPATPPSESTFDQVLLMDRLYSLGFQKPSPGYPFGSSARAFGTSGSGGSFAFADPDAQVGYAYAPSKMGFYLWDDPREKALRDAFYGCLKRA